MEDKLKPAFLDAENVAFIDAKNAQLDAQRKVIEELVKALECSSALDKDYEEGLAILTSYGWVYENRLEPGGSASEFARRVRESAIAKAKELTK